MTRRRLSEFLLGCLLLLGATASLLIGAAPAVRANRVRTPGSPPDGRPVVRWVFGDADLMSCQTPAYALRHIRSRYGGAVELEAIGVDVDEESARSFLRTQRLHVRFVSLSAAQYRERFAANPVPGMFVIAHDRVLRSYPANRRYPEPDLVISAIQASLNAAVQPLTYAAPTSRRSS